VHVVGRDNPGVDAERCAGAHLSNGLAQEVDLHHQEMRVAVTKVHREEEGSTRNPIAAIVEHARIMLVIGSRRNALPLFRPTPADTAPADRAGKRLEAGETQRGVARSYNVPQSMISRLAL
jgi:hypothetical protein